MRTQRRHREDAKQKRQAEGVFVGWGGSTWGGAGDGGGGGGEGVTCTLLHQGSHSKPEAVQEGEVVLHDVRAWVAGVGVIPFVRAEPAFGEDVNPG